MGEDLIRLFTEWNLKHFDGELPVPELRWNGRLQTTAGRFIPETHNPIIEVAKYLLEEQNSETLVRDTLGHEMIHYWLWIKQLPYGHNADFYQKMEEIGVNRYNPVPRHRPFKHCYVCRKCDQKIWVRKRLKGAACADCCNQFTDGKYHVRFKLKLDPNQISPPVPQVDLPKRA